ncbi:hypothetical protein RM697_00595 [Ichthyenterobacterium sp. W332]|uniref:Kazal-like domain-containing protein n=1 Tax=Microcosmobacter mediterraneus TaxID=3075607 RepID=A0ABU2YG19_9FLAO|nr:hypothetical protein [Ichthyenterobacterium sp. W332]MDT0557122.1 hypothetical protein [Ichthyenterobacterium sp. W332]
MKKIKIALLSLLLVLAFSACTNNEPVFEEQQIEESESITTALNELGSRLGSQGDVMSTQNPAGNIVFDFCFDFVYPIDLSYNNGTTVSVNSLDELISVLINFSDDLYVNGIAFPFDVEVFNEDTDAIEIVTVNNEEEFAAIIESCDFDVPDCECYEVYEPVCVEVTDPSGVSFTLTYPNACWAECDGFTENDFLDDCGDDYNGNGGFECFEFNYPITIITDNGTSVTVNSDEELNTAVYNSYYFDFEYPLSVTTEDGEVVTINNVEDFYEVLDECYDDYNNGCDCEDDGEPVCVEIEEDGQTFVIVFPNECYALCEGFTENNFVDCNNVGGCDDCPTEYDPVCVEVQTPNGSEVIEFFNACIAECEGFTSFVECEDDNGNDCSEEDYIENLVECPWILASNNSNEPYLLTFTEDGTLTIVNEDESFTTNGNWNIGIDPITGGYTVTITEEFNDFNNTYNLFDCDAEIIVAIDQSYLGTKVCD